MALVKVTINLTYRTTCDEDFWPVADLRNVLIQELESYDIDIADINVTINEPSQ